MIILIWCIHVTNLLITIAKSCLKILDNKWWTSRYSLNASVGMLLDLQKEKEKEGKKL